LRVAGLGGTTNIVPGVGKSTYSRGRKGIVGGRKGILGGRKGILGGRKKHGLERSNNNYNNK
jgi:hypothetical protein